MFHIHYLMRFILLGTQKLYKGNQDGSAPEMDRSGWIHDGPGDISSQQSTKLYGKAPFGTPRCTVDTITLQCSQLP